MACIHNPEEAVHSTTMVESSSASISLVTPWVHSQMTGSACRAPHGGTAWRHRMAAPHGDTAWRHCMAASHDGHRMAAPHGGTASQHCPVRARGACRSERASRHESDETTNLPTREWHRQGTAVLARRVEWAEEGGGRRAVDARRRARSVGAPRECARRGGCMQSGVAPCGCMQPGWLHVRWARAS